MAASAMITAAGGVSRSKEVMFTCVADREVSYIALDKTFSGTLPQWLFLQDFEPVTERNEEGTLSTRIQQRRYSSVPCTTRKIIS